MDRFELEQQILGCWNITDELALVTEYVMESRELDRDKIANILIGMKGLYDIKFQRCFDTFETLVQDKRIT
jgi:hypothetical protein